MNKINSEYYRRAIASLRVWRIRRTSGIKDCSNYYHHADIIAATWQEAIKAAKAELVNNWRCVDIFDVPDRDYCNYEYLYETTDYVFSPINPVKPALPNILLMRNMKRNGKTNNGLPVEKTKTVRNRLSKER